MGTKPIAINQTINHEKQADCLKTVRRCPPAIMHLSLRAEDKRDLNVLNSRVIEEILRNGKSEREMPDIT